MKKIFTILIVFFAICAVHAQPISIFDDVEGYEDFAINPTGTWTFVDVDSSRTYGFQGIDFPGAYGPMAAIVFNPSVLEGADVLTQPYSGSKMFATFAAQEALNNDWMISPELTGGTNGYTFEFWAASLTEDYGRERFRIGYSTTTNDVGAFTTFVQPGNYAEVGEEWTLFSYNIPAEAKYVALNCVSYDAFVFLVDDISITINEGGDDPSQIAETSTANFSIYPNPVTEVLHVNATGFDKVEIVNFLGQVVFVNQVTNDNFQINTTDLTAGVYFVRMSGEKTVTKKFVKE